MTERRAKQVIVMRKDLNMRKGKMIAQGAHASMKVLLDAGTLAEDGSFALSPWPALRAWLGDASHPGRFAKICVSVTSEADLDDVMARAQAAGLPCGLIIDSGATEFHGVPTKTCCAIGPAWPEDIDPITGTLPLL